MKTALVVYSTKKGATKKLAECISDGLKAKGIEVDLKDSGEIASEDDLKNFDGYVVGSPTYYTEPMEDTARILELAGKAELKGKVGAAFGAYGWSGEAPASSPPRWPTNWVWTCSGAAYGQDSCHGR